MMVPMGLIEGFFGRSWTDDERLAYPQFLQERGFDFYVYAPKADRYLRSSWREPIPEDRLEQIERIAKRFRASGLRFGVGLTPYDIHRNCDAESRLALKAKVAQLNLLGADMLCFLADDMRGDVPGLAQLQTQMVAEITEWSSAAAFIFCPTYYSDDPILEQVFGPAPEHYLEDLGRGLDPAIDIFWTGESVCSAQFADTHVAMVAARLGRKPFIWDNRIANDGRLRCSHLYLDPCAEGYSPNRALVAGVAINPMNQPYLSRVPLSIFASLFTRPGLDATSSLDKELRSVCGASLGAAIQRDLALFQNQGLLGLSDSMRASFVEKYRRFEPNACALEIVAWLEGEYAFDPACLTQ